MSATANTIMAQIAAAAANDFSAGDSALDLSTSGLVVEGEYAAPAVGSSSPFVAVSPPSIARSPEEWNLGQWGRMLECTVAVWAPSPDVNATRRAKVLDLASDIGGAIEDLIYPVSGSYLYPTGGTLRPYNVISIEVTIDTIDGLEEGMVAGYGLCVLGVTVVYQKARGF